MSFVSRYIVSRTGPDAGQRLAALSIVSSFGIRNCSRTLIQNFSSGDAGVGGSFAPLAHESSGVTNGTAPPMASSRANSRRFITPPAGDSTPVQAIAGSGAAPAPRARLPHQLTARSRHAIARYINTEKRMKAIAVPHSGSR